MVLLFLDLLLWIYVSIDDLGGCVCVNVLLGLIIVFLVGGCLVFALA